jgi:Fe-S-cluster-containing hydrogenase component 2
MRGLKTTVVKLRHEVFKEIATIAYETESEKVNDAIESLPYKIISTEVAQYRDSVYHERAIMSERIRLAMGLSLRPADKPVHITSGVDQSNISDKYYEPPLMQVIPSACDKCEDNVYEVSNQCRGCVAKACVAACPKDAIHVINGDTVIDREKCIRCGKCKRACPYDAIAHKKRPCSQACGIKAIGTDELGRAKIDNDKCVACGQCMVACPFGAIDMVSLTEVRLESGEPKVVANKCDLCHGIEGGPVCVDVCLTGALTLVEEDDLNDMLERRRVEAARALDAAIFE